MKRLAYVLGALGLGCGLGMLACTGGPATDATPSTTSSAVGGDGGSDPADDSGIQEAPCIPALDAGTDAPVCGLEIVPVDPEPDPECTSAPDPGPPPLDGSTLTSLTFHATGAIEGTWADGGPDNAYPPGDAVSSDPNAVRALYAELSGLSTPPQNCAFHCPIDYPIQYHLTFSGPAGSLTFDIDPTGCNMVTVEQLPDRTTTWLLGDANFWTQFEQALGIPATDIPVVHK